MSMCCPTHLWCCHGMRFCVAVLCGALPHAPADWYMVHGALLAVRACAGLVSGRQQGTCTP